MESWISARILLAAVASLFILGLVLTSAFFRRLRRLHREAWEEAGEPRGILDNSIRASVKSASYLWSGRYRELSDRTLSRLGAATKLVTLLYLILLTSFLFLRA